MNKSKNKNINFQARNHLLSKKSSWLYKVFIPNEKNKDSKGQIISECLFDVLNFPKNQRKI